MTELSVENELKFNTCKQLEDNLSVYIEFWNDHSPLYAALALCSLTDKIKSEKFLKKADLQYDPFAIFLRGLFPSIRQEVSPSYMKEELYSESALFGYCPSIFFYQEHLWKTIPKVW